MRNNLLIMVFVLYCSFVYAEDFVCYDSEDKNAYYVHSIDPTQQPSNCVYVLPADHETVRQMVGKFFKKGVTGYPVEMSQAEKDAILQAEEDARQQALLDAIDKFDITNLDLLTALIKVINVRIPSNPITKQEMIDQIKDDLGL